MILLKEIHVTVHSHTFWFCMLYSSSSVLGDAEEDEDSDGDWTSEWAASPPGWLNLCLPLSDPSEDEYSPSIVPTKCQSVIGKLLHALTNCVKEWYTFRILSPCKITKHTFKQLSWQFKNPISAMCQ